METTALLLTAALFGGTGHSLVVPVEYADARGATDWNAATRTAFLEDPDNRIVLSDADVRARAGRGPLQWLPSTAQCRYISYFVAVSERYALKVELEERQALRHQRQRCYTQFQ